MWPVHVCPRSFVSFSVSPDICEIYASLYKGMKHLRLGQIEYRHIVFALGALCTCSNHLSTFSPHG